MKKNIIIFIVLLSTFLLSLTFISNLISVDYRELKTDSGFDASWDSGSSSSSDSGSSSSWDSGSDYRDNDSYSKSSSSGSGRSRPLVWYDYIVFYLMGCLVSWAIAFDFQNDCYRSGIRLAIGITMLFLFSILFSKLGNNNIYLFISFVLILLLILYEEYKKVQKEKEVLKLYTSVKKSSSYGMNLKEILKDAYQAYVRIQLAWMNDEIDSVSDILSDEMLNQYKAQLSTMRVKHEQNVMNSFRSKGGFVCYIKESPDPCKTNYNIIVILKVKCKDYLINKDTKEVLRGKKNKNNYYVYKLHFIKSFDHLDNCPNCGAVLEKGGGVVCASCGSKVIVNNGNMVMTDKKMLYQK